MQENRSGHSRNERRVLEQDRKIAQPPDQPTRQRRENEVIINRVNPDETDFGQLLVQTLATQQTPRIRTASHPSDDAPDLVNWIPRVAFVKHHFTARRQQLVHNLQKVRCVFRVQEVHGDNAIERPSGQKTGHLGELNEFN